MSTQFCKEAINFLLDLVQTSYTKLNGSTSFIRNVTYRTFSRPQKELVGVVWPALMSIPMSILMKTDQNSR